MLKHVENNTVAQDDNVIGSLFAAIQLITKKIVKIATSSHTIKDSLLIGY